MSKALGPEVWVLHRYWAPTRSLWVSWDSQLGRGCDTTGSLQGNTSSEEVFSLHSPLFSLLLFLSSTIASPQIFTGPTDIAFPFHPFSLYLSPQTYLKTHQSSLCFHIMVLPSTVLLVFLKDHQTGNERTVPKKWFLLESHFIYRCAVQTWDFHRHDNFFVCKCVILVWFLGSVWISSCINGPQGRDSIDYKPVIISWVLKNLDWKMDKDFLYIVSHSTVSLFTVESFLNAWVAHVGQQQAMCLTS